MRCPQLARARCCAEGADYPLTLHPCRCPCCGVFTFKPPCPDPGQSCGFSYSWSVTPRVDSVDPAVLSGTASSSLRVRGSFVVAQPVRVLLMPAGAAPEAVSAAARAAGGLGGGNSSTNGTGAAAECTVQAANSSVIECSLPADLLPGAWQVRGGRRSVSACCSVLCLLLCQLCMHACMSVHTVAAAGATPIPGHCCASEWRAVRHQQRAVSHQRRRRAPDGGAGRRRRHVAAHVHAPPAAG